jgi:hypothetical protein
MHHELVLIDQSQLRQRQRELHTLRETMFGGGRGLLSFRVDDDAEMIHVFAIIGSASASLATAGRARRLYTLHLGAALVADEAVRVGRGGS